MSFFTKCDSLFVFQSFKSFDDFEQLFHRYKSFYKLTYKAYSTRYVSNDKKAKGKDYNCKIKYSEYRAKCKEYSIING